MLSIWLSNDYSGSSLAVKLKHCATDLCIIDTIIFEAVV